MPKGNTRSENLDERLKKELELMIELGYPISPISRSTVQSRLGLKSRSTLVLSHRAVMIENARIYQLKSLGLDSTGKKKRNTLQQQIENLKEKNKVLESDNCALIEKIAMIVNGLHAKGYDVEELMLPLRPNFRK